MLTFDEAKRMLAKCETKKLARNTYLREENGRMVIKFWDTDIITIDSEAVYTLNSGGYRTSTTKERFNTFSPADVYQEGGLWYVGTGSRYQGNFTSTLFADGIRVNTHGHVIDGAGKADLPTAMRKVDRLVSKYIAGYAAHVMEHGIDENTGGDCWGCLMQDTTTGKNDVVTGYAHYLDHFTEKYYVPSILIRAVQEVGYGDASVVWYMMKADIKQGREPHHIKHALRKYFRSRKQGIAEELVRKE